MEYCHAVWLDPQVDDTAADEGPRTIADCLGRAEIGVPAISAARRARDRVGRLARLRHLLDDMLGSLYANGRCHDAAIVVFALNSNPACERVIAKYGAALIRCEPRSQINPMSKAILFRRRA